MLSISQKGSKTKHICQPWPKYTHPWGMCGVLLDTYLLDTEEATRQKTPCAKCLAVERKNLRTLQEKASETRQAISGFLEEFGEGPQQ